MGFFQKKKTKQRQQHQNAPTQQQQQQKQTMKRSKGSNPTALTVTASTDSSGDPSHHRTVSRWSPVRSSSNSMAHASHHSQTKQHNNTSMLSAGSNRSSGPTTTTTQVLQQANLLQNVKIVATDTIEVMTAESQRSLLRQREAIRKQLFDQHNTSSARADSTVSKRSRSQLLRRKIQKQQYRQHYGSALGGDNNAHDDGDRHYPTTAMNTSQEILANGRVVPDFTTTLTADQASVPMSYATSFDTETDEHHPLEEDQDDVRNIPHVVQETSGAVQLQVQEMRREHSLLSADGPATTATTASMKKTRTAAKRVGAAAAAAVAAVPMVSSLRNRRKPATTTTPTSPYTSLPGSPPKVRFQQQKNTRAAVVVSPGEESSSRPMDERDYDAMTTLRERNTAAVEEEEHSLQLQETGTTTSAPQDTTASTSQYTEDEQQPQRRNVSFSESEDDDDDDVTYNDRSTVDTSFVSSHAASSRKMGLGVATAAAAAAVASCGSGVTTALTGGACGGAGAGQEQPQAPDDELQQREYRDFSITHRERPVYLDEASTQKFLKRILRSGFVVLYLLVEARPDDDSRDTTAELHDETWAGRTVTMAIAPGRSSAGSPARLEWTTVAGGQRSTSATLSVDLLDILAIDTSSDTSSAAAAAEDDGADCIFTITTETGAVHLFEATCKEERDRIVHGLRTVLARWAFHLVAGDTTATSELYQHHPLTTRTKLVGSSSLHSPAPPNPEETMNAISHLLLDE